MSEGSKNIANHDSSPFGADTQRYWENRNLLFSRFDQGIKIDREGLFSVKPEQVASEIAAKTPGSSVLDAFCGVGGSAIAFARAGKTVVSVDSDFDRVQMARHNARIYGVGHRIEFICDDIHKFFENNSRKYDSIYLDPPWGGPDYFKRKLFTLGMFSPDGAVLLRVASAVTKNVILTVPKNFDFREIQELRRNFFVQRNFTGDRMLFSTIFFEDVYGSEN